MPVNRENPSSLANYRNYQRQYQKEYGKTHYTPSRSIEKKKYYIYKTISVIFRNILLEN